MHGCAQLLPQHAQHREKSRIMPPALPCLSFRVSLLAPPVHLLLYLVRARARAWDREIHFVSRAGAPCVCWFGDAGVGRSACGNREIVVEVADGRRDNVDLDFVYGVVYGLCIRGS
ncbi:hypothetical protein VTL71DRAFT_388 [Oculimacula yallundae]|uniref:Uncharacterized protein n=1 Tax=Oculimacula yallundae TaxID=86028 RepID=A0ABR4CZV4_9HELO